MRLSYVAFVVLTWLAADLQAQNLPLWFEAPPIAVAEPRRVTPVGYEGYGPPGEPILAEGYAGYDRSCYVQADALYWHRVGNGCDDLLVLNSTTGDELLNAGDLYFNGSGGFRVLVGWQPHACCPKCTAWEASYFGLWGLNAGRTITGAGDLAIPGDLGLASNNFFLADTIDVNYFTQVNNFELNCVKSCCLCCTTSIDFLCGFRYFNLNEELTISGTDVQEGTSAYTVQTYNHLFGLQLGGRYNQRFADCWSFQLTGKAGVFFNAAEQEQQVTDFPNTSGAPFFLREPIGATTNTVAALAELDFVLVRKISDTWSLRLGYSVLGIGGLALAPDQLDFTDTFASGSTIHNDNWILLHGGLVGLEASW